MSSILRALRKLEKESSRRAEIKSLFPGIKVREAANPRIGKFSWGKKAVAFIFVIAIFSTIVITKENFFEPDTGIKEKKKAQVHTEPVISKPIAGSEISETENHRMPEPVADLRKSTQEEMGTEKLFDDSRFRIQAIAWKKKSDTSIAVVNDRIVREGSSIQGVSVIMIREDNVVFREKDNIWTQKFRIE